MGRFQGFTDGLSETKLKNWFIRNGRDPKKAPPVQLCSPVRWRMFVAKASRGRQTLPYLKRKKGAGPNREFGCAPISDKSISSMFTGSI